ncbi:MAG: hypothetical protein HOC09_35370 [Deltaproteobacteria bacterium]|nr:hypothetical protein [Deltaproteobacteria bacterium]
MFNRTLSPHGFRIGPALYTNIHWTLTTPNSDWLGMPFLPEGFVFPAKIRQPPIIDGKALLPSRSGPGLALLSQSSGDSNRLFRKNMTVFNVS